MNPHQPHHAASLVDDERAVVGRCFDISPAPMAQDHDHFAKLESHIATHLTNDEWVSSISSNRYGRTKSVH